jgi:hypothetical protein
MKGNVQTYLLRQLSWQSNIINEAATIQQLFHVGRRELEQEESSRMFCRPALIHLQM